MKNISSYFLVFTLCIVFLVGNTAFASESETNILSAEVLWKMERVGSPVISPDGKWVVAPVTRYEVGR